MSKAQVQIENLDILQALSPDELELTEGGLTLAPDYFPSPEPIFDGPKGDGDRPYPSKPFYPLPIPCHPSKPSLPRRIAYPCGCSLSPTHNGLPWCAVIL